MELNQQIATLQDELKLLKGEIKAILREVRTAVLSRDNPFTIDSNPPTFRAVGREEPTDSSSAADETDLPTPQADAPRTLAEEPIPLPTAAPAQGAPYLRPVERETPSEHEAPAPTPPAAEQHWNLLTVASLAAWAEDALAELGPRRFQMVLELSCLAGLLASDMKEVLGGMSQFAPEQPQDDRPMHINKCLVVLHQLEAILQGEKVSKLPRRRRVRHGRAR